MTMEDGFAVTATFACVENDDTQNTACQVTSTTKEATYEADGQNVYTASVTWNGNTYTDTKTVTIPKKVAENAETEEAAKPDNTQKSDDTKHSDHSKNRTVRSRPMTPSRPAGTA